MRKANGGFASIGVYALDTALYLMGHPRPVAVSAITSNYISLHSEPVIGQWGRNIHETEVEDFAAAWVRFENGARLVFKTSWCMHMDSMRESKPSPIAPDGMLLTNVIIQGVMDSAAQGGKEVAVTVPTFD